MLVECRNYHGLLSFPRRSVRLVDLVPYASKYYNHRPTMVTYRDEGVTLLIFTSFKFRLMGKGEKHKRVLQDFLRKLPWKARVSEMSCTMTVSHSLNTHINLHTLDRTHFQVELELFPAAKLRHSGREHVNVFHTGKLMITGVRDVRHVQALIDRVTECIKASSRP